MQASIVKTKLKVIAFFIGLCGLAFNAHAQHCEDGCNININGPQIVHVGETVTYTITPNVPNERYMPLWDEVGFLDNVATILDKGKNADGDEYITVRFYATGDIWLTYVGDYYGPEDYDEMTVTILP